MFPSLPQDPPSVTKTSAASSLYSSFNKSAACVLDYSSARCPRLPRPNVIYQQGRPLLYCPRVHANLIPHVEPPLAPVTLAFHMRAQNWPNGHYSHLSARNLNDLLPFRGTGYTRKAYASSVLCRLSWAREPCFCRWLSSEKAILCNKGRLFDCSVHLWRGWRRSNTLGWSSTSFTHTEGTRHRRQKKMAVACLRDGLHTIPSRLLPLHFQSGEWCDGGPCWCLKAATQPLNNGRPANQETKRFLVLVCQEASARRLFPCAARRLYANSSRESVPRGPLVPSFPMRSQFCLSAGRTSCFSFPFAGGDGHWKSMRARMSTQMELHDRNDDGPTGRCRVLCFRTDFRIYMDTRHRHTQFSWRTGRLVCHSSLSIPVGERLKSWRRGASFWKKDCPSARNMSLVTDSRTFHREMLSDSVPWTKYPVASFVICEYGALRRLVYSDHLSGTVSARPFRSTHQIHITPCTGFGDLNYPCRSGNEYHMAADAYKSLCEGDPPDIGFKKQVYALAFFRVPTVINQMDKKCGRRQQEGRWETEQRVGNGANIYTWQSRWQNH